MTAPYFNILTQKKLTIDLSRPAMQWIIYMLERDGIRLPQGDVQCELDNFVNTLQNLLERSETGNLDLVGG